MPLVIRPDDLSGDATRALVAAHLAGMLENTPVESVHALDVDRLTADGVTVWSAWVDDELAGIGACKDLDLDRAELKSMRVAEDFLGQGIGRAILRHIMDDARERGIRSLWLETGSTDDFLPARRLYASEGFVECPAFAPYQPDPLSTFMTREL
ncbi:putative acetyltransferase [Microbacterium testaceum]|uniref:GNAT family N-acetyltransferase n=2 Tax=Microbacteriaceae TaxID=85023 RepID=UPI00277D6E3C|nr:MULTISPECIES: GNAT family N-acetyltransferase [Microbacterium]MDQ1111216.1 putative acetyltransferase [Microbacterium testaceum]MDQ1175321.1 putative acetyltransferase [Microbacterium sp. SORGH_AS_0421]